MAAIGPGSVISGICRESTSTICRRQEAFGWENCFRRRHWPGRCVSGRAKPLLVAVVPLAAALPGKKTAAAATAVGVVAAGVAAAAAVAVAAT